MEQTMQQQDHDLLISISIGQQDLKTDVRGVSEILSELKKALEITNQRQSDLESRVTNISNSVQRVLADANDMQRKLGVLDADITRWKLYIKAILVMSAPIYTIITAVIIIAIQKYFLP